MCGELRMMGNYIIRIGGEVSGGQGQGLIIRLWMFRGLCRAGMRGRGPTRMS